MRNKEEIENYDIKAKFLEENGWETWYHDDNWINKEWKFKIDNAGISTDKVYYSYFSEKNPEIEISEEIFPNYKNAIEQLNNIPKDNSIEPIEID